MAFSAVWMVGVDKEGTLLRPVTSGACRGSFRRLGRTLRSASTLASLDHRLLGVSLGGPVALLSGRKGRKVHTRSVSTDHTSLTVHLNSTLGCGFDPGSGQPLSPFSLKSMEVYPR